MNKVFEGIFCFTLLLSVDNISSSVYFLDYYDDIGNIDTYESMAAYVCSKNVFDPYEREGTCQFK